MKKIKAPKKGGRPGEVTVEVEHLYHPGEGMRKGRKPGDALLVEPETHGLSQFHWFSK